MQDTDFEAGDIETELEEMQERCRELHDQGLYNSELRLLKELRRRAKTEQKLIPYLYGSFSILCISSDLLQPALRRDVAMEVIGLLESEDSARKFQGNFDEHHYAHTQQWMTACGYDNLAMAVGEMKGFNSEGMQQCISDGIDVCRRTGKTECIHCFREYAVEVYSSADDLDLAIRFAIARKTRSGSLEERHRYTAELKQARLHRLEGRLQKAWELAVNTWSLRQLHHNPYEAEWSVIGLCKEIALLTGNNKQYEDLFAGHTPLPRPAAGEDPMHDLSDAQLQALEDVIEGRFSEGISILTEWDRRLQQQEYQSKWIEVRLRLLCAHRLAGNTRELERLSEPLRKKAESSRDWLTLRLLNRILDPAVKPYPVPMTNAPDEETGAGASSSLSDPKGATGIEIKEQEPTSEASKPGDDPGEIVQQFMDRFTAIQNLESFEEVPAFMQKIAEDILNVAPEDLTKGTDCSRLINMLDLFMAFVDGKAVWEWVNRVGAQHREDAHVMNSIANLSWTLLNIPELEMESIIDEAEIESGFRRSLELAPDAAMNHMRAGEYFLAKENLGEAEHCLARSFRLLRNNSRVAGTLSNLYRQTDRERDALEVLDIAIREGCFDPELLLNAGILARELKEAELSLTYLDKLESLSEGSPWVQYYRGMTLLDLGQPNEALAASKLELSRNPEGEYACGMLEAISLGHLNSSDFDSRTREMLNIRPSTVETMSTAGISSLLTHLWKAAQTAQNESLRELCENRLLQIGLAPGELFQTYRDRDTEVEGIRFFRVLIRQPLDEDWKSSFGVLPGEEGWKCFMNYWGVLAESEEHAVEQVFDWQSRVSEVPCEIVDVSTTEDIYTDVPGIIWQGQRGEPDEDQSDSETESDEDFSD